MFCPNCGNRNPDNANVCGICGTRLSRPVAPTQNMQQPVQNPVQRPVSQPTQPPAYQPVQNVNYKQMPQGQFMTNNLPQTATKKSKKSILIAVICAVLAIAIGVSAFFIIKKKETEAKANTPEAIAEKYVKAIYEFDVNSYFEVVHEKIIEEIAKSKDLTVSEYKKKEAYDSKSAREEFEKKHGKYTVTTKAISCEKLDGENFNYCQKKLKNYYDLEISDIRYVEVEYAIKGEKRSDSGTLTVYVAEVGSKWYVANFLIYK